MKTGLTTRRWISAGMKMNFMNCWIFMAQGLCPFLWKTAKLFRYISWCGMSAKRSRDVPGTLNNHRADHGEHTTCSRKIWMSVHNSSSKDAETFRITQVDRMKRRKNASSNENLSDEYTHAQTPGIYHNKSLWCYWSGFSTDDFERAVFTHSGSYEAIAGLQGWLRIQRVCLKMLNDQLRAKESG